MGEHSMEGSGLRLLGLGRLSHYKGFDRLFQQRRPFPIPRSVSSEMESATLN